LTIQGDSLKETADHMRSITDELRLLQRSLQESLLDGSCMGSDQSARAEAVEEFKSAIDQMRQFLWFYLNAMSNGEQLIELLRQAAQTGADPAKTLERMESLPDYGLVHYYLPPNRKPN
jgi:DNA polymerase III gamma/tau subunit